MIFNYSQRYSHVVASVKLLILLYLFLLPGCSARTQPVVLNLDRPLQRIAFGSCLYQFAEQAFWPRIAAQRPDFFVFTGDNVYADWDGSKSVVVTEARLKESWHELNSNQYYQDFMSRVPVLATWDNHDFGSNASGAAFSLREKSRQAFLRAFKEPEDSDRWQRGGVYTSYTIGPTGKEIQLILLDTRSFREEPVRDFRSQAEKDALGIVGHYVPDSSGSLSLLGEVQWRWLEREFEKNVVARVLVSSIQVISDEKGMDEWGNYPAERARLYRLIAEKSDTPLVLVSGNIHFGEVSVVRLGGGSFYEVTSSGLSHAREATMAHNPHRVGEAVSEQNFGMLHFDWTAPEVSITATLSGVDGRERHRVAIR